jgi:WhiB family redox-sensing transcriptional regulator
VPNPTLSTKDYFSGPLFNSQGSARGESRASYLDELLAAIQQHFRDEPWQEQAACVGLYDDDNFFPNGQGRKPKAQKVCRNCPVREECGDYAIRTGQMFGMWGGIPERRLKELVWAHKRGEDVVL